MITIPFFFLSLRPPFLFLEKKSSPLIFFRKSLRRAQKKSSSRFFQLKKSIRPAFFSWKKSSPPFFEKKNSFIPPFLFFPKTALGKFMKTTMCITGQWRNSSHLTQPIDNFLIVKMALFEKWNLNFQILQ